ncbi:MAG: sensor histidine kinase N-terminal domain-containing protein [Burkholderiales bacterium]|nr:sensor histidine kinase N-terminal domain-containing protein [Burkholderiales bacterium]
MPARSLRAQLLRRLLAPVAVLLALGAASAYRLSLAPASDAYDQALADIALALGERIRVASDGYAVDLPAAAERALRTDRYDTIYYQVRAPDGTRIAGDAGLPDPPEGARAQDGVIRYETRYGGELVHVVAMLVPCGGRICTVQVAETGNKRRSLARTILLSSLVPELLLAAAALAMVWFGVKRGLAPLEALSAEIKARSARDLRPVDAGHAPLEARPLVDALNHLLVRVAEAAENQRRFVANAAHQLRTPLAGLQSHTELALAQELPPACRAELEQVHRAAIRTARLANQLLALARAEPGGVSAERFAPLDLRSIVEASADEWVHRSLARGVDLGFELAPAPVRGDALLLREALANLIHNAIEYAGAGARVTVRTGARDGAAVLEVEDDGPGIAPAERERVLERFYRIPGTPGEGSGLGLAIVREIAQAHGAALEVGAGAGGRGCRVVLRFAQA